MSEHLFKIIENAELVVDILNNWTPRNNVFTEEDYERKMINGWQETEEEIEFLKTEPFIATEQNDDEDFDFEESDVFCAFDSVWEALEIFAVVRGPVYIKKYSHFKNRKRMIKDLEECIQTVSRW
jgi:hypothetical protein